MAFSYSSPCGPFRQITDEKLLLASSAKAKVFRQDTFSDRFSALNIEKEFLPPYRTPLQHQSYQLETKEDIVIKKGQWFVYKTGVKLSVPKGCVVMPTASEHLSALDVAVISGMNDPAGFKLVLLNVGEEHATLVAPYIIATLNFVKPEQVHMIQG